MDTLRVVGNESVHPGVIDLDADDELLPGLFGLVNLIVDQVVARPKRVALMFAKSPDDKRTQIEQRDAGTRKVLHRCTQPLADLGLRLLGSE